VEDKTEIKEAKKPYKTPTLTKYGKVEPVTQGAGLGGAEVCGVSP